MENSDLTTGTVGKPMTGLEVRLINWESGSYRVTDRPNPRGKCLLITGFCETLLLLLLFFLSLLGEICISGPTIAKGYYKLPEKNEESFTVDKTGKRWFKTGDIGEYDKDGRILYLVLLLLLLP